ncbi:MAG TPA: PDZ domain-containing protein [Candidatus Baltobacteraceae bacterium]|nr:PDZ domain-containing protein [Candidatus Baltobacteraceae bacterium]
MTGHPAARRLGFAGFAVLAILNLLALLALAQVEWNALDSGSYGLTWDTAGRVHDVVPNGPAARAGIVVGDRVDLNGLTPEDRMAFLFPNAGEQVQVPLAGAQARSVKLTADLDRPSGFPRGLDIYAYPLLVLIALCLATAIVLLRPGRPTWTYYAFVWLSTMCGFQNYLYVQGPLPGRLAVQAFQAFAFVGALFTLTLFSTRILRPEREQQVRRETTVVVLCVLDFLVWSYFMVGYALAWWHRPLAASVGGQIADIALAATVLSILWTLVGRAPEQSRGRVRWIVTGLALQPVVIIVNSLQGLLQEIAFHYSSALSWTPLYKALEPWAAVIGALVVSYAFVNEHIIDIGFVIGRATGYAVTSALLVLFMAVSEWSVGELFADSHLAAYATLAAALLGAFSFNAIHHRIDALLDWLFFRREFLAEQRLKRDARSLAFVTTERTAVELILDEPLEALELSSAALFKLDEDRNVYACAAMRSWPQDAMITISTDDVLIAQLRSEREPLALREIGWAHEGLPAGAQAPVIAVPALARSDLYAFALYGGHRDGSALNSEERALLGALVASAAATFDHLDAQRAREEIADLRRRLSEVTGTA